MSRRAQEELDSAFDAADPDSSRDSSKNKEALQKQTGEFNPARPTHTLDFESFFFVGHTVLHRVSQTRSLLALNAIRVPVYQREQVIPIQLFLQDQLRRENVYFLVVDRSVWSFTHTKLTGKTLKRSLVSP